MPVDVQAVRGSEFVRAGKRFPTGPIRFRPAFNSDYLCSRARRVTGLAEFGDAALFPALDQLVESLHSEAELHARGRFLMQSHLQQLLIERLKLVAAWKRQRDPAAVTRPIFITGIPRSGSTLLHELLTVDPANRAVRTWETMFPLVAAEGDRGRWDSRVWKAAACLWMFRRLGPGVDSAHPLRARTPQECVAIHSYTLHSEEFLTTCRLPGYEAYLRSADMRVAYGWQKRFLQHLHGGHSQRWVLKAPDHSHTINALFDVFPGPRFGRKPLRKTTSFCDAPQGGRASVGQMLRPRFIDD